MDKEGQRLITQQIVMDDLILHTALLNIVCKFSVHLGLEKDHDLGKTNELILTSGLTQDIGSQKHRKNVSVFEVTTTHLKKFCAM